MFIKKLLLCGSITFLLAVPALAQTALVRGTVLSKDGEPLEGASVFVSSLKWGITDAKGGFKIEGIRPGSHTLKVQHVSFQDHNVHITILPNQNKKLTIVLEDEVVKGAEVIVTASRTEKHVEDVSVPVTVISNNEIEQTGSLRLNDILDEQIGMNIVSNHGTGIQVQGFDPDYTLILIDNQPVIGRTAGTLDLTRLAVGNVKQVEIVKGPSSALWGSNALAGVINIITEKAEHPFEWGATGRYGSNNSYDAATNISLKKSNFSGQVFGNVNSSSGYDLNEATLAPTIPEYDNYTFTGELGYRFSKNFSLGINSRYYSENQNFRDQVTILNTSENLVGTESQQDVSVTSTAKLLLGNIQLFEGSVFLSQFNSESNLDFEETGDPYFADDFEQTFDKYELKSSTFWSDIHTTISGIGMNREDLTADIYANVPYFDSYFAFAQHEWNTSKKLSLTGGFRFDSHSEYSSQLSPKFSGLYKPSDKIHLRASVGSGFKAPAFRQLFLNFTNPVAGYSVFGSSTVVEGVQRLQEDNQIQELYFNPNEIADIKAERSFAYNAGIDLFPSNQFSIKINAFRNNVRDLIETQRIALKTNGQSVFSYFNLNKIYTQGFETELRINPAFDKNLSVALGYQFLDAQREITRQFDDVVNGQVVSVTKTEYVSLFNRSKHTSNLKVFYTLEKLGLDVNLRIRYRGKYGFADINSNQIIDDGEYAESHTIINTSIAKEFKNRFRLQFGVNNISNYQNEQFLPSNPGITFYTQLNIKLY